MDFNVPLDEKQNITDDRRIVAALPTIKKIIDDGGYPIVNVLPDNIEQHHPFQGAAVYRPIPIRHQIGDESRFADLFFFRLTTATLEERNRRTPLLAEIIIQNGALSLISRIG